MRYRFLFFILFVSLLACDLTKPTQTENTRSTSIAPSPVSTQVFQIPPTKTIDPNPSLTAVPEKPVILVSIKMFDENHGWLIIGAEGASRRVLHTDDGGVTWEDSTPDGIASIRGGIYFLNSQTAWIPAFAVDSNIPTIYQTTDSGKSWRQYQNLPFESASPYKPFSLHFSNPQVGWATVDEGVGAGHYAFTLYQTVDGGSSWTQLLLAKTLGVDLEPKLSVGTFLVKGQSIEFLDLSTIWFGGDQAAAANNVFLQVSRDAGKTWRKIHIDVPAVPEAGDNPLVGYSLPVFITSEDAYLLVGYSFQANATASTLRSISVLMLSHDGGETWTASPTLLYGSAWDLHLQFITPNDAFSRCLDLLCLTHDGGQTWKYLDSNVSFGNYGNSILSMWDFVNVNTGWAIVYDGVASKLIRTMDGGNSWSTFRP